jgi:lysophospholipid acyltransferase (LPLAT)-like uncharacterized protein
MAILRQFVAKFPWLDEVRTDALTKICTAGINFYERNYPITRFVSREAQKFLESDKKGIIAMYHGRIIGILGLFKDRSKITGLVSYHRDGELLARFGEALGYNVARGSATYKAVEGALQMVDASKAGQNLAITVEITGLPIIPYVCTVREGVFLHGWDRIMGGFWGTPMVYVIGDPMYVPPDCSSAKREELRLALEQYMEKLRDFSDGFWLATDGSQRA